MEWFPVTDIGALNGRRCDRTRLVQSSPVPSIKHLTGGVSAAKPLEAQSIPRDKSDHAPFARCRRYRTPVSILARSRPYPGRVSRVSFRYTLDQREIGHAHPPAPYSDPALRTQALQRPVHMDRSQAGRVGEIELRQRNFRFQYTGVHLA